MINKIADSVAQALAGVKDGATVLIGGFGTAGIPDVLIDGLNSMGWNLEKTKATFYVWAPVPKGYDSMSFCAVMLEKCGIIVVPGVGYGPAGEGYVRFALTLDESRIKEALQRMKQHLAL